MYANAVTRWFRLVTALAALAGQAVQAQGPMSCAAADLSGDNGASQAACESMGDCTYVAYAAAVDAVPEQPAVPASCSTDVGAVCTWNSMVWDEGLGLEVDMAACDAVAALDNSSACDAVMMSANATVAACTYTSAVEASGEADCTAQEGTWTAEVPYQAAQPAVPEVEESCQEPNPPPPPAMTNSTSAEPSPAPPPTNSTSGGAASCTAHTDCNQEQNEVCQEYIGCARQACTSNADCDHYTESNHPDPEYEWFCQTSGMTGSEGGRGFTPDAELDGFCRWIFWIGAAPTSEPIDFDPSAEPPSPPPPQGGDNSTAMEPTAEQAALAQEAAGSGPVCSPETPNITDFNHASLSAFENVVWTAESFGVCEGVPCLTSVRSPPSDTAIPAGVWVRQPVDDPCGCMDGRSWWHHQYGPGNESGIQLKMMDDGFKIVDYFWMSFPDIRFTHPSFGFSGCSEWNADGRCHACYNACPEGDGGCYSACDEGACGYVCSPENPTVNDFHHESLYGNESASEDLVWSLVSSAADGTMTAVRASENSAGVAPGVWNKQPVENPCGCMDGRSWWVHEETGDSLKFMDDGYKTMAYPRECAIDYDGALDRCNLTTPCVNASSPPGCGGCGTCTAADMEVFTAMYTGTNNPSAEIMARYESMTYEDAAGNEIAFPCMSCAEALMDDDSRNVRFTANEYECDSTEPVPQQTQDDPNPVLYASATFDIPITAVEGSAARASFEADFKEGVVASMASGGITISESNVEVVAISAGSIIVDFQVSVDAAIESQVTARFEAMATNPSLLSVGTLQSVGVSTTELPPERTPPTATPTAAPAPANSHAPSTKAMVGLFAMTGVLGL